MPSVIYISKTGDIKGLADDTLDKLNFLGEKKVERVSEIEFDHSIQKWVAVSIKDKKVIASHPIRSVLIDKEREYLNDQIEKSFISS